MKRATSIIIVLVVFAGAVATMYAAGFYPTDMLSDGSYSSPFEYSGTEVPAPGSIDDTTTGTGDGIRGEPTESVDFALSGLDISIEEALSMCQSKAQECLEKLPDTEASELRSAYMFGCDEVYSKFTSNTTSMSEEEIAIFEEEGSYVLISHFDDAC